eukprot:Opistho-2@19225
MDFLSLIDEDDLYTILNQAIRKPYLADPSYLLLIDVRSEGEYSDLHVIAALRAESDDESDALAPPRGVTPSMMAYVVLYGDKVPTKGDPSKHPAFPLAELLATEYGVESVSVLDGGFDVFCRKYPFLCDTKTSYTQKELDALKTYPSIALPFERLGDASTDDTTVSRSRSSSKKNVAEGDGAAPDTLVSRSRSASRTSVGSARTRAVLHPLYIGNSTHAHDRELLDMLGVKAVLNATKEFQRSEFPGMAYLGVPLEDEVHVEIMSKFDETFKFIDDNRKCGPVFVFCNMGVSRSSTIVIAYMMRHKKWTLLESFEYLKSRRRGVCPNRGFQLQLSNLEELIFGEAKTDITGGLY